jgi:cellulose synthase/poly-beta-1,6-N-acetylglucosamine synthase-like glycosyltransferase
VSSPFFVFGCVFKLKPILTVGMCLRNCEKTLKDAVESVIKQDFPHELMEIIFVDDGSEDRTFKIIMDYVSRIDISAKVVRTDWKGIGNARNLVVKEANGDYITWVDGDQILPKDYLRKQVEFMDTHPKVGVTAGVMGFPSGNTILTLELIPSLVENIRIRRRQPRNFLWKTEKLIGTGGATFRVDALRKINGFDTSLCLAGEDTDIVRRIKDAGWLVLPNNSIFYERHGGMSTLRDLLSRYFRIGSGHPTLYRKNRKLFSLPRMSPLAGFFAGFFYSLIAYKLIHRKIVFLLPFHFALKMTAWCLGFLKGQIAGNWNLSR